MIKKNIIEVLKKQHIEIEKILQDIERELETSEKINADLIHQELEKFKKIVQEHISIEDNEFYPSLLQKMEELKEDTTEIKNFIERINIILENVYNFLNNYGTVEKIKESEINIFKASFIRMMSRIEIRINAEELFVYNKWTKIKSLHY